MIVFFFFGFCLSEDLPIGRILSEKKHRGKELVAEKTRKFCKQNLTKERKQPPEVTPQQGIFYNTFILCLWLRIIVNSDQGVQFMNFHLQIFFNEINHGYRAAILKKNSLCLLPSFTVVATYCYYEKVRRTMGTAIVSYLLNSNIFLLHNFLYFLEQCF